MEERIALVVWQMLVTVSLWVALGWSVVNVVKLRGRVKALETALAAKNGSQRPASATRIDDQVGGRTWEMGSTEPLRSPRAREQRGE